MTGRRRPPRADNKTRDAFIILLDDLGFSQPILSDAFHITSGRIKQIIDAHRYPNRVRMTRAEFLASCHSDNWSEELAIILNQKE